MAAAAAAVAVAVAEEAAVDCGRGADAPDLHVLRRQLFEVRPGQNPRESHGEL